MSGGLEAVLSSNTDWLLDLPNYQKDLIDQLSRTRGWAETAEAWLQAASPNTAPFGVMAGARIFYQKVLDEVHDLLCSRDKYDEERRTLAKEYGAGKITFTAGVTSYIAPALGADPTMLAPVVAIVLTIVGQASLRAWCELHSENRAQREGGYSA
ncbi:hypothetical protein SAMN03159343_2225 [Klenkia marina]|uniref:Uncharacterized protein n=1 Tax=Klenkia marina TaxID=1960309 RepID=A0A1G4Y7V1_9ACTN|nr:hypothetical protein [Klenkia marina]SCX49567.1 hypothetical protein SAMN03159343_2225 [Klenkia marina]